jgi:hypothetical protein
MSSVEPRGPRCNEREAFSETPRLRGSTLLMGMATRAERKQEYEAERRAVYGSRRSDVYRGYIRPTKSKSRKSKRAAKAG